MLSIFVLPLLLASAFAYPYLPAGEMEFFQEGGNFATGTLQTPNYESCVNENGLKYILDVTGFTEKEINVTLVENTIFVLGKKLQHAQELADGSYFYYGEESEFRREYTAPEYIDMDPKKVNVTFVENDRDVYKVLIIEAPSKPKQKLTIRTISPKVQNHYVPTEAPMIKSTQTPVDTTTLFSTEALRAVEPTTVVSAEALPAVEPTTVVPAEESTTVEPISP